MKLSKAAKIWIDHHQTHSKKNTFQSYWVISEAKGLMSVDGHPAGIAHKRHDQNVP
jgi:oligoribonuclease NrnB/cAMP/cGMP phosphodiesterase (DHH superfamily)